MDYTITSEDDHYNVYINDEFYCSSDTIEEAAEEIDNYYIED